MNSRTSQTNLQLQLQLTGWLAFSATLRRAHPRVRFGGPQGGRTRVHRTRCGPGCQKMEFVKTNSGSTCRISTFTILRTRRSPFLGVWPCCFSPDDDTDPGAELQETRDWGREKTPNAAKIAFTRNRIRRLSIASKEAGEAQRLSCLSCASNRA